MILSQNSTKHRSKYKKIPLHPGNLFLNAERFSEKNPTLDSFLNFFYSSSEKPARPNAAGPPWVVITPLALIQQAS